MQDHPDHAFQSYADALAADSQAPAWSFPREVDAALRKLRVRRGRFNDEQTVARLAPLFTQNGLPMRGVKRKIRVAYQHGSSSGSSPLSLCGFEIEGVVHGVRGGMGWAQVFEIERRARAKVGMRYYLHELTCHWDAVEPLGPVLTPEPFEQVVKAIMAERVAQALEHGTPSVARTKCSRRF